MYACRGVWNFLPQTVISRSLTRDRAESPLPKTSLAPTLTLTIDHSSLGLLLPFSLVLRSDEMLSHCSVGTWPKVLLGLVREVLGGRGELIGESIPPL
jgi:hypothetical protein